MVKRLSNPMHTGGSSPFNKKEWVIKEWPMCNRAITVSSFLFCLSEDKQYILLKDKSKVRGDFWHDFR